MIEKLAELAGAILGTAVDISLKAFLFTFVAVKTLEWLGVIL